MRLIAECIGEVRARKYFLCQFLERQGIVSCVEKFTKLYHSLKIIIIIIIIIIIFIDPAKWISRYKCIGWYEPMCSLAKICNTI